MSEYWKSTPKYWCKYCSIYVKDTPLEKTNHEASPRHQGNLKKSLRDLHRSNERAERDKQFAKAEAARLNGSTSSAGIPADTGDGKFKTTVNFTRTGSKPATADDRKRQMAQLAAMGVAVPEDFRRENAMVGGWQTTSQKVIWEDSQDDADESKPDVKPGLNVGVRKRKIEEKDEEDEEEGKAKLEEGKRRPRFGRDSKTLPQGDDEDDLDALLGSTTTFTKKQKTDVKDEIETDNLGETVLPELKDEPREETVDKMLVKREISDEALPEVSIVETSSKDDNDIGSIFKKRKKPIKVK